MPWRGLKKKWPTVSGQKSTRSLCSGRSTAGYSFPISSRYVVIRDFVDLISAVGRRKSIPWGCVIRHAHLPRKHTKRRFSLRRTTSCKRYRRTITRPRRFCTNPTSRSVNITGGVPQIGQRPNAGAPGGDGSEGEMH
jgi:hypothetical protein